MNGFNNYIAKQTETNYSVVSENIDIYPSDYSFPLGTGTVFPNNKLKERADLSLTNNLIYNNEWEKLCSQLLTVIPEVDAIYGMQIMEICASLPFGKRVVDSFIGLCAGNGVIIDTPDIDNETADSLISMSNIHEAIESMIKTDFTDACSLYKVTCDNNNRPVVEHIPVKNYTVYNDPENINSIYSIIVHNILRDKIEFIEYKYDGEVIKRVFKYLDNTVGVELEEPIVSYAYNGKYKECPLVFISNNVLDIHDTYGRGAFQEFDTCILAVQRAFMNLLRLLEKTREVMKVVPENALTRTITGQTIMLNRGTVTYSDGQPKDQRPDISYVTPDLKDNIEACLSVLKQSIKMLSMSSGLAHIFFDFEKVGTGTLSGKALRTMMYPTLLLANNKCTKKKMAVQELCRKICLLGDIDIVINKFDVNFNCGIQDDADELNNIIDMRLKNNTISLEDAIVKLDNIPKKLARERVMQIKNISPTNDTGMDVVGVIDDSVDDTFSTEDKKEDAPDKFISHENDIIPDYQMPLLPRGNM